MAAGDLTKPESAPRHRFVEALLVDPVEPADEGIEARYDERRALTLTASGEPLVTTASAGETHTLTEVRDEHEDRDEDPSTLTFVQSEGYDRAADGGCWAGTVTVTKATGEADDADDLTAACAQVGTRTGVRGESEDFASWASTLTGTRVAAEQSDQD